MKLIYDYYMINFVITTIITIMLNTDLILFYLIRKRANQVAKERYEQIQAQFAVEEKERQARQQAFDDHGDRINEWEYDAKGVRRNLRTLLTKLPTVLWQDSGWQPITLANLVQVSHVKKHYRQACKLVHPDRSQQRGDSTERKV